MSAQILRFRNVIPALLLVQACTCGNEFVNTLNQRAVHTSTIKNSNSLSFERPKTQTNDVRETRDLTVSPLRPR